MIQIVTKEGISLDLAPDAEFVIEYNNPMMEDERIPVPFSTSIALLPSATNCKVFQYLPALKLEPAVKKIAVSLVLNGIPFLSGTLNYDGIEDGALNYTFAGKDLEEDWGMKIWEMKIQEFQLGAEIEDTFKSSAEGIFWPLLVNKEYTGYFVQDQDNIALEPGKDADLPVVERNVKYHNFQNVIPEAGRSRVLPAVSASAIIGGRFLSGAEMSQILSKVVILGQYNIERGMAETKTVAPVEVAQFLPDLSFADFIKELCRMFSAAIYNDGWNLRMLPSEDILSSNAAEDWSEKLSDEFTLDSEEASGYSFGYANSDEDSFDDTAAELSDAGTMKASLYPTMAVDSSTTFMEEKYTKKVSQRKIYTSGTSRVNRCAKVISNNDTKGIHALIANADVIFQNNLTQKNDVKDADSVDNSCGFNLIKCVPSILTYYQGREFLTDNYVIIRGLVQRFSTAGVVEPVNADAERGTDTYVGLINNGQISDSGYVLRPDVPETYPTTDQIKAMTDQPLYVRSAGKTAIISLTPDFLYNRFHKSYAVWLAKDRQLLTCDVNLSEFDLLNFRMYRKVRIHGRDFLVKKLSVTLRADSEAAECSADFIAV